MNRKQQIALVIMAVYFVINIQTNLGSLIIQEDQILDYLLNDRVTENPGLEDLDPNSLRILSSQLASYIRGKTIISAVNAVLLVYLFATYLDMYRNTKSGFTLGLVFLSAALLSYSLFTNPVILSITGESGGINLIRYFNFLPDLFTTIASTVLIYLSRQ